MPSRETHSWSLAAKPGPFPRDAIPRDMFMNRCCLPLDNTIPIYRPKENSTMHSYTNLVVLAVA